MIDSRLRSNAYGYYEIQDVFGEWVRVSPVVWQASRPFVPTRYVSPTGEITPLSEPQHGQTPQH